MSTEAVELKVFGQTYRVASSASSDELERLASVVEHKLRELSPTSAYHPQSMLLVAISLAHEVEEERSRRVALERRSREMIAHAIRRVDTALALTAQDETESAGPTRS